MKTKFFLKNLAMFTLPLLIPLLILGSLSVFITQQYVKNEINKNNINLLNQMAQNIEMIFNELDALIISFNHDYSVVTKLRQIFEQRSESFNNDNIVALEMVSSMLKAPANSKPYIRSIYVYYENDDYYFISTKDGLTRFENCIDTSWYNSFIGEKTNKTTWIEIRNIKENSFQVDPFRVVTIYTKLFSSISRKPTGVVVLNIRTDYVENTLKKLVTYPEQEILVIDENNQILFSNILPDIKLSENLAKISNNKSNFFSAIINGKPCIVSKLNSSRLGLKYISIIPQKAHYNIHNQLIILTSCLLIISFVLGLMFTYYLTQKNYKQVSNIISIINCAEKGEALPSLPDRVTNEYSYIIYNILKTFIEQSYLKVQLSKEQYRIQAMQLMALQSQINPHFLYNTLHTIYWEAFSFIRRENKLTSMVSNLSSILKYSLEDPFQTVQLRDEVDNTLAYIKIQQLRYIDRFEVIWSYDESYMDLFVIKLLLQPLIENCIYHGFKENKGKSHIKVKINKKDSYLKISVTDNGLGISKEKLEVIRANMKTDCEYPNHIGLFNTNKRLKIIYGENYGLKIRSKLNLGTTVYLNIPIDTEKKIYKFDRKHST